MVVMSAPPNVKAARGRSARRLADQSISAMVTAARAAGRLAPEREATCDQATDCSGIPASGEPASSSCQVCGTVARESGIAERGIAIGSVSRRSDTRVVSASGEPDRSARRIEVAWSASGPAAAVTVAGSGSAGSPVAGGRVRSTTPALATERTGGENDPARVG